MDRIREMKSQVLVIGKKWNPLCIQSLPLRKFSISGIL